MQAETVSSQPAQGQVRIGCSGWQYKHWRELFYPKGLPQTRWFAFYAEHFDTVEINSSFYHLPKTSTFEKRRDQAPGGFCYAVKANRFIVSFPGLARSPAPQLRGHRSPTPPGRRRENRRRRRPAAWRWPE
jgi:uncharacterized protein YecE (DUF72 family)